MRVRRREPASYKVYDARARILIGNRPCEMAIEYERLLKSAATYKPAIQAIKNDTHISFVLYICATEPLKDKLKPLFKHLPKVWFVTEQKILSHPLTATLEQIRPDSSAVYKTIEEIVLSL